MTCGAYDDEKLAQFGYFGTAIYMVAFFVLCVVNLNLLIAIISDKFDSVFEQALNSDYQEKCLLLIEYENLTQIWGEGT